MKLRVRRSGKVTLPGVRFELLLCPDLCLVWFADRHGLSPLSVRESLPQSQLDSVQHCFIGVVLRDIRALQDLEGVVAAFHNVSRSRIGRSSSGVPNVSREP